MAIEYYRGAELPDAEITWLDSAGSVINFSTGYTFQVKIGNSGSSALFTKSTGITGASTAPNILISWSTDDLSSLPAGTYDMDITANLTAQNKDRIQSTTITILDVVG